MDQKRVHELLGTREIPGSPEQLEILRMRLQELAGLNGEEWITANREQLLQEWECIICNGLVDDAS